MEELEFLAWKLKKKYLRKTHLLRWMISMFKLGNKKLR